MFTQVKITGSPSRETAVSDLTSMHRMLRVRIRL